MKRYIIVAETEFLLKRLGSAHKIVMYVTPVVECKPFSFLMFSLSSNNNMPELQHSLQHEQNLLQLMLPIAFSCCTHGVIHPFHDRFSCTPTRRLIVHSVLKRHAHPAKELQKQKIQLKPCCWKRFLHRIQERIRTQDQFSRSIVSIYLANKRLQSAPQQGQSLLTGLRM